MTSGRKIQVGKSVKVKDGKLVRVVRFHSKSAAIAASKNPKRKAMLYYPYPRAISGA